MNTNVEFPVETYSSSDGSSRAQLADIVLEATIAPEASSYERMKRWFDVLIAFVLIVIGMPCYVLVAIAIRLSSKGPVIYRQVRVGQGGQEFTMLKFRTMIDEAEKQTGPIWAAENDSRYTKVGLILRQYRLDEAPQLLNVLKGEMSLVGPRPERPHFVNEFVQVIPGYVDRLTVKPGITGWAQIKWKYDTSIEDVRTKLTFDLHYLENRNIWMDFKIIMMTMFVVLNGKGQ